MESSYFYLVEVAIILLATKLLGLFTKKVHMPQVVGALLAGLILGPAVLGILTKTEFITQVAGLGVIVLMFIAGLETDIKELKKCGKASFIIALFGVAVPLIFGLVLMAFYNNSGSPTAMSHAQLLENIFIGIILTATSVSITVETLRELKCINTKAGSAIIGAAIIDDVLGIIGLTIITSMADESVQIGIVFAKIAAFFILAGIVGIILYKVFDRWTKQYKRGKKRMVIMSFVMCLAFAFCGEHFFGVADITGAFIAGLIISNTYRSGYIRYAFETLSYMLLAPVFFASIGLNVVLPPMSASIIIFTVILVVLAIVTKLIGCGIGAKLCKYSHQESVQIGTGMISRGEVALIVANKGAAIGLMPGMFMGPIIIMVVITSIVTPILLKLVFKRQASHPPAISSGDQPPTPQT